MKQPERDRQTLATMTRAQCCRRTASRQRQSIHQRNDGLENQRYFVVNYKVSPQLTNPNKKIYAQSRTTHKNSTSDSIVQGLARDDLDNRVQIGGGVELCERTRRRSHAGATQQRKVTKHIVAETVHERQQLLNK